MTPSTPPPLPPPAWAGAWLAVLPVAGFMGVGWLLSGLPTPACAFHRLTNLSCPTCGLTRGFRSLLEFDLVAAWIWNPLAVLLPFVVGTFWLYCLAVQRSWLQPINFRSWPPRRKLALRLAVVLSLALFWGFRVF